MPARSGAQYLTGLRDQREVWCAGERVTDAASIPQRTLREDVGGGQLDVGEGLEGEHRAAGHTMHGLVAAGSGIAVNLHDLGVAIDHPVLGDAGLGVEAELGRAVVGERAVTGSTTTARRCSGTPAR